jgi:iron-sulfur cluster insertion protein
VELGLSSRAESRAGDGLPSCDPTSLMPRRRTGKLRESDPYERVRIEPGCGKVLTEDRRRMITITEKAAAKVTEIAKDEDLLGQGLRLRVIGGGCAGFSYDLYFEDKPTDMDEQFEDRGIKLYIDPLSYQYLDGTEIDYVEGLHGSGFKFQNPNVKSTCGCGSSFSA